MCCTALIKAVSDRCHRIMMFGCLGGAGGMGGGESSGGGWGRKDHPHGSLCNNDSNVNDGAATSINSGLLQELQRRPAGGFTLQSADLGHVGVSHPAIREGRDAQETNNNTHTRTRQAALLHLAVPFLLNFGDSAAFSAGAGRRRRRAEGLATHYLRRD